MFMMVVCDYKLTDDSLLYFLYTPIISKADYQINLSLLNRIMGSSIDMTPLSMTVIFERTGQDQSLNLATLVS